MDETNTTLRLPKVALSAAAFAVLTISLAAFASDLSAVSDLGGPEPAFQGNQTATITQYGSGNTLNANQLGRNGLVVSQKGVANEALTSQAGTQNWMSLSQAG